MAVPIFLVGAINVDGPGLNRDSVYTEFLAKNFPNRLRTDGKA
jgi:hypothetical protein